MSLCYVILQRMETHQMGVLLKIPPINGKGGGGRLLYIFIEDETISPRTDFFFFKPTSEGADWRLYVHTSNRTLGTERTAKNVLGIYG